MTDRTEIFDSVAAQVAPFNKKGVALTETTTFAGDLEWDSLTVMDFVAAIEDEFDILITMNMQAEIETVGQLVDGLEGAYAGIAEKLLDDSGEIRRYVNIFVNDEDIRFLDGKETPLNDGDDVSIVPAIAGGR